MLLTCSSCNSRYLMNSADLQPNGRTVRCAKCYNEWFQEPNLVKEEVLKPSSLNNFNEEEKEQLEKIKKNIIDSLPVLLDKKLDLFSSTVNNK